MTEKRTPGVLLVNYVCHFLLSSFYCGAAVQWRQRRKTPSRMKWRFSAYRRRWRVMPNTIVLGTEALLKKKKVASGFESDPESPAAHTATTLRLWPTSPPPLPPPHLIRRGRQSTLPVVKMLPQPRPRSGPRRRPHASTASLQATLTALAPSPSGSLAPPRSMAPTRRRLQRPSRGRWQIKCPASLS